MTRHGQMVVRPDKRFFVRENSGQNYFCPDNVRLVRPDKNVSGRLRYWIKPIFWHFYIEIKGDIDRDNCRRVLGYSTTLTVALVLAAFPDWQDSDLIPRLLETVEFWNFFLAGLFNIQNEAHTKILRCVGV